MRGNNTIQDEGPIYKPGFNGRGNLVYEPLSVLSLSQRLGRLRYACYQLSACLMATLLMVLVMLFCAQLLPAMLGMAVTAVVAVLLLIYTVGLMVRRLHDMDLSGWWALLSLAPIINLPFHLFLYLGDASSSMNRFGTPNPPPGGIVAIAGGLFWLINVLSIIAAIALLIVVWLEPEWLQSYLGMLPGEWRRALQGWREPF